MKLPYCAVLSPQPFNQKRLQVGQSDTFTVLQFQDLLSSAELK